MDSKSNNFDTDFKNVTNKWDKKEREIYEECDNAFSKEYDI